METRSLRRRKAKADDLPDKDPFVDDTSSTSSPEKKPKNKTPEKRLEDEDQYSPWVDIARVITFLFLASCILSYVLSGGESMFWGQKEKPKLMRISWWKNYFVSFRPPPALAVEEPADLMPPSRQQQGPLSLTLEELAAYDGTDPEKPIYLAINGTIYDVTAGRRIYGPDGSYKYFAGCDASRAYVTGCFADDRTADMRGVEQMYLPIEDPEVDAHWTREELNVMRNEEFREAKKKTHEALKHWVDFFAKSDKYVVVGKVKREEGWLKKVPRRKLCDVAEQGRSKRTVPEERLTPKEKEALAKKGGK
jgi:predicted heme/steroid binding protein